MDKSQTLRKSVAAILALSTLVWGTLAMVVPSSSAAQRHTDGSVVLHNNTVWKIDNGTLRGFPSLAVFQSHGYSFNQVLTATTGDAALPVGANMDFADGTLVNDGGTVYIVNQGEKRGFTSAAVFTGLGYSFSNLVSGSTANFTAGAAVSSTSEAHPAGTLVLSGGTIWQIRSNGRAGVPSLEVFNSYGWNFGAVVAANAADNALTVLANVEARANGGSLVDDGTTPTTGGSVSVSLASDTPASALIVEDATRVPFTKVVLTNTGSSAVTVDTVKIERGGVAANGLFSGVLLIDAGTNDLLDVEKTLNSDNQATFTKDFTISAGSSKSVILAGRFDSDIDAYAGQTPTLGVVGVTLTGGGTVTGAPVYGNKMTANSTINIGGATVANDSTPAANSSLAVGSTGFEFTRFKITAGSEEDIVVSQIKIDNMGTAADGDVTNIKLNLADGTNLATVAQTTNKEALFNISPLTIGKGLSKTFSIVGDVSGGSARTVEFEIEETTDVVAKGVTYGYYVTASGVAYTAPAAHTISTGTFKVESAAGFAAANVPDGADDVAVGAFDFIVKGESMAVSKIGVKITRTESSGSDVTYADITNVKLVAADGTVVAGPIDLSSDYTATSTDTFTVPVGTTRYTVKADLSTDFDNNDTLVAELTAGANITAKGSVTNTTVTATPSTAVTSATQTVKSGALQVSVLSTPIAQSVVKGTSGHTFANIVLDASASSEDIRVTQLKAAIHTGSSADPADVNGFKIFNGSTELSTSNDPDPTSTTADAEATSTFSLSPSLVITKGTSVTLTIKGNISANAGSSTYAVGLQSDGSGTSVSATGVTTSQTITPTYNYSDGQNMTFVASGTLTLASDASSPAAGLLAGSKTDQTVAVLSATAQNEAINIEKLYITAAQVNSGGWDQIDKLKIYDGSTLVASVTPTATDASDRTVLVDITSSPLKVDAGTTKTLTVKVDTATVNAFLGSKGTAGEGFDLKINATGDVTAKGVSSGAAVTVSGTPDWNQFQVFKSIPTVTKDSISATLANGTMDLYKFTVSADSKGDVGLAQFAFAVATSGVDVAGMQVVEINGSTETTLNATGINAGDGSKWGSDTRYAYRFFVDLSMNNYRTVPAGGSRTYVLRGSITGASSGDSISVNLLGDNAALGEATDDAFGSGGVAGVAHGTQGSLTGANGFIWSDLNYSNTTTATSTDQWSNGYRVPGLTSTSTTQTLSL